MTVIRSIEDLARAEAEALERRNTRAINIRFQIRIGLASCGIAAGASDTFEAFKRTIAKENLTEVCVSQLGCNGMCSLEPIVQVQEVNRPQVTYGKVTPEVAQRIIQRHIKKGQIVRENVVENF
jgi:NADP-reducing hydrogenase subunit HndB